MKLPDNIKIYGDINYRGLCAKESAEQITFFNYIRKKHPKSLGLIAVHNHNEGSRHIAQTMRYKADGMITGASDIIIPGAPSFVCELKRRDHTKSTITVEQINYLMAAANVGAFACIALGCDAAIEAVEEWQKKYGIE